MKATKLYTTMKQSRAWIFALVLAIVTLNVTIPALAHGGMEHITGTITSVGDNVVTVKTTKGATVQVHVDAKTEYARGKQAAKMADLKEGERIVVHAMEMNGSLVAHEVSIGGSTSASKGTQKTAKK